MLSHDPRNCAWPKHRWDLGSCPSLSVQLLPTTSKLWLCTKLSSCLSWCLQLGQELSKSLKAVERQQQGWEWSEIKVLAFPLMLGLLNYELRIGHNLPGPQQTSHCSSSLCSPSSPCCWWQCFKGLVMWKQQIRLVKMTLKKETERNRF